jgi:EAL domain-containing protein (putative c-di-GMP-specific phosphodiesterase class I)
MRKTILETILDPRALSVHFQPIFRIKDGLKQVDSLEALIRGPRNTNFARADILFDYVRRKKAEAAVDQSCLTAICEAVVELPRSMRVNVNVHASTLGQRSGFVEFFKHEAKKRSLALERFTLEIVEHAPTCNIPELTKAVAELRNSGVMIALDDVGLGQSNYRMMLDCDPDYFKMDAYFVRGLDQDPKRRAVIESLSALAKALGSAVVAEGPNSAEDLSQLAALGVEFVQANLLCPAKPLEELQKAGYVKEKALRAVAIASAGSKSESDLQYHRMHLQMVAANSFYT